MRLCRKAVPHVAQYITWQGVQGSPQVDAQARCWQWLRQGLSQRVGHSFLHGSSHLEHNVQELRLDSSYNWFSATIDLDVELSQFIGQKLRSCDAHQHKDCLSCGHATNNHSYKSEIVCHQDPLTPVNENKGETFWRWSSPDRGYRFGTKWRWVPVKQKRDFL